MKMLRIVSFPFLIILLQSNTSEMILMKFISGKGDTLNVYFSDVIKIDTIKNTIELSPSINVKLGMQNYENGKILLNTGNETWINVYIYNALSSSYFGEPSITISQNGSLFFYDKNLILIKGEIWKIIANKIKK